MSVTTTLNDKKEFLEWFLDSHELKQREAMWILNYLLNHEIILNKVHFIESADKTTRGMLMTAKGATGAAFIFQKDHKKFHNPEQAFHDIRLNWHSDLYIDLQFPNAWQSPEYLTVLEDNPFYSWNETIPEEVQDEAQRGMNEFLYDTYREEIMDNIHKSLESGDRELFLENSEKLSQLEEMFS